MKKCCFISLDEKIITPDDYRYEEARQEWNRAIQKYPIALIYCENNEDVAQSILWAQSKQVPIRVRSGGHNYQGYSSGNGVVIIDVSKMNKITINEASNKVKLQAGVRNKSVYDAISPLGYTFPGGTCPTVGVSGYTLGGGWGLSARKLGLGCDSLVEAEIIDYKGCLIKSNKYENKDLFWALRGAGGQNFGVVVSMTFELPQKVDYVTYFELYYPNISESNQIKLFTTWQNWIITADSNITLGGGFSNSKTKGIYARLRGISYKNLTKTKELLQPFYDIDGLEDNLEQSSFYNIMLKVESGYPEYQYFKSSTRFVDRNLSSLTIENILKTINNDRPEGSSLTQVSLYGLGGKISDKSPNDTAFYHRNAHYMIGMQTVFEDNKYREINYDWFDDKYSKLLDITNGSYVNFPYDNLCYPGWSYYGKNICRLMCIKNKYDPYNVFNYPQGL
ncbi:MAG: FAD-binding protein [Paraclostridium sp.]